jgi:hypothetical protein
MVYPSWRHRLAFERNCTGQYIKDDAADGKSRQRLHRVSNEKLHSAFTNFWCNRRVLSYTTEPSLFY